MDGRLSQRDGGAHLEGRLRQRQLGTALDQDIDCLVVQDLSGFRLD
jgi:hypothetical protein